MNPLALRMLLSIMGLLSFGSVSGQLYGAKSHEKLFILTDKPFYSPGDTIYFSSLLYNSIDLSKAPLSKIVYVDLISPNDSMISTKKLYIEDVLGKGTFLLPDELPNGSYMIRGYTHYMRNFPSDQFFYMEFLIVEPDFTGQISSLYKNTLQKRLELNPSGKPNMDVKIEGGSLLEDVSNNLIFRITDQHNNGLLANGKILNDEGHPIGLLKTYDFGLGSVSLPAGSGIPSSLILTIENIEYEYPLDIEYEEGYHLRIINRGKNVLLNVASAPSITLKNKKVVGISRGRIIFEKYFAEEETTFQSRLLTNDLENGMLTFYLLEQNNRPMLKRRTFIFSETKIPSIDIDLDKELYKTRENFSIDLNPSTYFSDSSKTFLTVSIRDVNRVNPAEYDQMLFESVLINDKIPNIDQAYFFKDPALDQRDLFILELALAREEAVISDFQLESLELKNKPEKGIWIEGYTSELNKPDKPIKTNMLFDVFGKQFFHKETTTDDEGRFSFGPFYFQDTINVILQARKYEEDKYNKKGELQGNNKVSIWLDEGDFIPPPFIRPEIIHYEKETDNSIDDYLQNRNLRNQYARQFLDLMSVELDEVTIKKRRLEKKTEEEKAIENAPNIYSRPSNRIVVDERTIRGATSVFDLLRRVPGVTVFGNFPDQSARIRGVSSLTLSNEPLYLLDNVPVDVSAISLLNVAEVWFVDVLKGPQAAIFGSRGSTGVIAVFTLGANSRPSNVNIKRQPGIADFKLEGLSDTQDFRVPDYAEKPTIIRPDLRTILYWNPRLVLKGKDQIIIKASTSDNPGDYLIRVEGIDNQGRLIWSEKMMRVR